jgi:hypothetical protein
VFPKGFFWNNLNELNLSGRSTMAEKMTEKDLEMKKEIYEKPELEKKGSIKDITAGIEPSS